jgi:hypothetical protein
MSPSASVSSIPRAVTAWCVSFAPENLGDIRDLMTVLSSEGSYRCQCSNTYRAMPGVPTFYLYLLRGSAVLRAREGDWVVFDGESAEVLDAAAYESEYAPAVSAPSRTAPVVQPGATALPAADLSRLNAVVIGLQGLVGMTRSLWPPGAAGLVSHPGPTDLDTNSHHHATASVSKSRTPGRRGGDTTPGGG